MCGAAGKKDIRMKVQKGRRGRNLVKTNFLNTASRGKQLSTYPDSSPALFDFYPI